MTKVLLILTVVLIFIYGFRMMSKLDRFLASTKGRNPNRTVCVKNMPLLRKALLLFISGESLRRLFSDPSQREEEQNDQFHEQDLPGTEKAQACLHKPHKG